MQLHDTIYPLRAYTLATATPPGAQDPYAVEDLPASVPIQ